MATLMYINKNFYNFLSVVPGLICEFTTSFFPCSTLFLHSSFTGDRFPPAPSRLRLEARSRLAE